MTEVYVFDCDGVIINSGEDIADCVNAALTHFGYWTVPIEKMITFLGDGARTLINRALAYSTKPHFKALSNKAPIPEEKVQEVLDWYLDYYYKHFVSKTVLYAGIMEFLKVLKAKGKKVGMLTNKPLGIAKEILVHFGIDSYFDVVVGPELIEHLKPAPDGLFYALEKINEKYGTDYKACNVMMIGDSDIDIKTGKAFGCKTCGVTGGLGDRERLLAQNPDLTFSVASELEKYIDILSGEDDAVPAIKSFAMKNGVPIMQDEGIDFICKYIKEHGAKRVLEIGSAIGYSAIRFAEASADVAVTTVEIDLERFIKAKENIEQHNLENRVCVVNADALTYSVEGKFDLIFIDAAKAQYINFFEKYKHNLADGGAIISDNLSFHGMVEDLSLTHNYSTKKLVKKIRKYIDFLKANDEFETEFFPFGDGISVSKRK